MSDQEVDLAKENQCPHREIENVVTDCHRLVTRKMAIALSCNRVVSVVLVVGESEVWVGIGVVLDFQV